MVPQAESQQSVKSLNTLIHTTLWYVHNYWGSLNFSE